MSDEDDGIVDRLMSIFAPREEYKCDFCNSSGYTGRILFKASTVAICADCVTSLSAKLYTFTHFLHMEPENKTRH